MLFRSRVRPPRATRSLACPRARRCAAPGHPRALPPLPRCARPPSSLIFVPRRPPSVAVRQVAPSSSSSTSRWSTPFPVHASSTPSPSVRHRTAKIIIVSLLSCRLRACCFPGDRNRKFYPKEDTRRCVAAKYDIDSKDRNRGDDHVEILPDKYRNVNGYTVASQVLHRRCAQIFDP